MPVPRLKPDHKPERMNSADIVRLRSRLMDAAGHLLRGWAWSLCDRLIPVSKMGSSLARLHNMKILRWLYALWLAGFVSTPLTHAVTFAVSPIAVSNTYAGYVSLQVSSLTAGDTVLVQKYLDANANGVI